jgi:hypothetical protein
MIYFSANGAVLVRCSATANSKPSATRARWELRAGFHEVVHIYSGMLGNLVTPSVTGLPNHKATDSEQTPARSTAA